MLTCLKYIPEGILVHNIEMKPQEKVLSLLEVQGHMLRLWPRTISMVTLKLPSGEMRMIHEDCLATIGVVGNKNHENIKIGKAGRSRWLGRRPKVRRCCYESC